MTLRNKPVSVTAQASGDITDHIHSKSRHRRVAQKALSTVGKAVGPLRNDLAPDFRLLWTAADELKPADRRVRKADRVQVERIKASIARFGISSPIVVDGENRIIHGHLVWEAAKELGVGRVPTVALTHLDPTERRALALALNRLGETGSWDIEILEAEMRDLIDLGEDLVVTGFDEAVIDGLTVLGDGNDDAKTEAVPGVPLRAVSRPGDVWLLGRHRLVQGDSRLADIYRLLMLPSEQIRLVLTDQPYNVPNAGHVSSRAGVREFAMAAGEMSRAEFAEFTRAWIDAVLPYVIEAGLIGTFIDWRSVDLVLKAGSEAGLDLINIIVWVKGNAGQGALWRSRHELLPVFRKGASGHVNNVELGRHGRWRSNVWEFAGASSLGSDARDDLALHPTVKPVTMLEDALLDVSHRDEIVLDPFAGSGSTLIAAETTGRIARAIEIDSGYCDVVIRRWQALTGNSAYLEATGATFDAVAAQRLDWEDA